MALGVDIFVQSELSPTALATALEPLASGLSLRLKMISNSGVQVYTATGGLPALADIYRCRFVSKDTHWSLCEVPEGDVLALLYRVARAVNWVHTEKLQEFAGVPGYTLAQGEA